MSDRRIPREGALRVRLLAGAALIACLPALPTMAQVAAASPAQAAAASPQPAPNTPGADGLTPGGLYVNADAAAREGDVVTASG
jgi:LPS-assembly protein